MQQIVDWLGTDFDGVIVFDESHAMQNAGGGKSERGDSAPSQQGRAGLRLQHALGFEAASVDICTAAWAAERRRFLGQAERDAAVVAPVTDNSGDPTLDMARDR